MKLNYHLKTMETQFNAFPNAPFWDPPKFREAADVNLNETIKRF